MPWVEDAIRGSQEEEPPRLGCGREREHQGDSSVSVSSNCTDGGFFD